MIAVMTRVPGRPPRAKASAALAPNRVAATVVIAATSRLNHKRVHEVARGEEFFEPAQRNADRRKLDIGRRIEGEHEDDGDRRQQENHDRNVEGQVAEAAEGEG